MEGFGRTILDHIGVLLFGLYERLPHFVMRNIRLLSGPNKKSDGRDWESNPYGQLLKDMLTEPPQRAASDLFFPSHGDAKLH